MSTLKRFVARQEYFGALVYDRERGDYIPFDQDAVVLFAAATAQPMPTLFDAMQGRMSRPSFDTFMQLCQSVDLIDEQGFFNGTFVQSRPQRGILSAPLRVHLAITNECPMACRHCFLDTREPLPNELTTEEIRSLLDGMAEMGTCQLNIGGGEPFLREDLADVVVYARSLGISVSLSTTATAVNRAAAKRMAEAGVKGIRISFDGAVEKSYDYHRNRKGAFRKAMRGIKALREVFPKVPFTMHTTLMKSNRTDLLALARQVEKLGMDTWSVDFVKPVGIGSEAKLFWLTTEEGAEVVQRLGKILETTPVPLKMAHFPYRGSARPTAVMGYTCLGANLFCYVSPNGSVAPCSYTCRQFAAGNIRRNSLHEIWTTAPVFQKYRSATAAQACDHCMKAAAAAAQTPADRSAFVMPTASAPA